MPPREHVHLALRRTGGLAGLAMVACLDTADLEPGEAQDILDALAAAALAPREAGPPPPAGAADLFAYQLDIAGAGPARTLRFGERQVPSALVPVVRCLMRRAAPAPRDAGPA